MNKKEQQTSFLKILIDIQEKSIEVDIEGLEYDVLITLSSVFVKHPDLKEVFEKAMALADMYNLENKKK